MPGDGVVLLDLDHFKRVNDRDGHPTGDAVLREVGAHLRRAVRAPDVAARLGGEEFLVILKAAGDRAEAGARRLLEGWRALEPVTTMSGGVAVHERGRPPEAALAEADAALYRAKASGRDRVATAARADLSPGARPAR